MVGKRQDFRITFRVSYELRGRMEFFGLNHILFLYPDVRRAEALPQYYLFIFDLALDISAQVFIRYKYNFFVIFQGLGDLDGI